MRLKKDQIQHLSQAVLNQLKSQALATFKASEEKILATIDQAITQDLNAEVELDQAVEKILDQYRQQIQAGHLNERELFLKIKKELAKKKKMVL